MPSSALRALRALIATADTASQNQQVTNLQNGCCTNGEVRKCVMGLRTRIVSDILPGKEKSPDGIVSGPTAVCPNTPAGGSGGQSQ